MNVFERSALTFSLMWTMQAAFTPLMPHAQRLQSTLILTLCIAYLYGAHGIVMRNTRLLLAKLQTLLRRMFA